MSALEPRFLRFVRSRGLVRPHDRLLVALSGGIDSMVLLHLLKAHRQTLQIDISAAHFDHGMRADSAADAEWLAGVCEVLGVRLLHARTPRPLHGETDARLERYRFLDKAARADNSTRIATAHHADDQIETVLFRILRGTGMRGLAGIPVRRGPFIRPLLRFRKSTLLAYAAAHDVPFREDPSNEQLQYMRNRIRKNVIPAMETVQPRAREAVLALARHAARTEKAWHEALKRIERELVLSRDRNAVELARPVLLEYHPQLRARALRHFLRRFGAVPGKAQTRHLLEFCENADSGSKFVLAPDIHIDRAFDRIRISRSSGLEAPDAGVAITGHSGQAAVNIGGRNYDVAWSTSEARTGDQVFDAALLESGLELRGWRPGDRIRLAYGTKKLKKLFAERRVPVPERARIPVLSDARGRVFWAVGVARSVDALPDAAAPLLNLTVKHAAAR
ncbi:MAG: tRNA lysidine(34) synthetase TilS [Gemmatimonadota bacterium]